MDATSRARFRVPTALIAALVGVAGCASADSGDESAMPSDVATLSETVPQTPSQVDVPDVGLHLEAVEPALQTALVEVMDRYQVPGAAVMLTTNAGTWSLTGGSQT